MAKDVFLTPEGKDDLEKRLENLKSVCRREIAEKIKVAREFGDISENAEYDAAKEEQAMIEGEILEIEQKLRTAIIIDKDKLNTNIVNVGSRVHVYDYDFEEDVVYSIVGTTEANPMQFKISNESPIGRALIGCKVGEDVTAETPGGKIRLNIRKIEIGN